MLEIIQAHLFMSTYAHRHLKKENYLNFNTWEEHVNIVLLYNKFKL